MIRPCAPSRWPLRPAALLLPALLLGAAPLILRAARADAGSTTAVGTLARVAGAEVQAELRDEYVQGVAMLVPVVLSNSGEQALTVPDLSARPWLVRFDLVQAGGGVLRRYTTPPDPDPGRTVQLPRRGQRRTLLEIPGAAGTAVGDYQLVVSVLDGAQPIEVARRSIRVVAARPVAGDLGPSALSGSRAALPALWVHQARQGADLYLHLAAQEAPARPTEQRFLLHLDKVVQPWLAAARAADAGNPTVVWATDSRGLRVVTLDPTGSLLSDLSVAAPWPRVELAGRPASIVGGTVVVPLWVPAPAGTGGELRVASIDARGRPGFPRLASFPVRPEAVQTTVDAAGAAHFLVQHRDGLDLYTARGSAVQGTEALPLPGRRLLPSSAEEPLVQARFAVLSSTEELAGGLSVLAMRRVPTGFAGRWLDLQGATLLDLPVVPAPAEAELVDTLANGQAAPGLLLRQGGKTTWVEGSSRQTLPATAGSIGLARDLAGAAWLRQLGGSQALEVRRLSAAP